MSDFLRSCRVPSFCPVCKCLMKGDKSTKSYYDFDCCSDCFIQFVEGREERWKNGWRPSQEQIASFLKSLLETDFEF